LMLTSKRLTPENGTEKEGGDGLLEWATAAMLNGLNGQESESGTFESGQRGHFSQSVAVEITYDQKDPELPTGEYSGFVKLVGMVIP
jgi:hypothetical protein